jgi:hypothetical protein
MALTPEWDAFLRPSPERFSAAVRDRVEREGRGGVAPWVIAQRWAIPTREVYKILNAAGIRARNAARPQDRG